MFVELTLLLQRPLFTIPLKTADKVNDNWLKIKYACFVQNNAYRSSFDHSIILSNPTLSKKYTTR